MLRQPIFPTCHLYSIQNLIVLNCTGVNFQSRIFRFKFFNACLQSLNLLITIFFLLIFNLCNYSIGYDDSLPIRHNMFTVRRRGIPDLRFSLFTFHRQYITFGVCQLHRYYWNILNLLIATFGKQFINDRLLHCHLFFFVHFSTIKFIIDSFCCSWDKNSRYKS